MRAILIKDIPKRKVLRLLFIAIFFTSFFIYRCLYNTDIPLCLKDVWHVATASANNGLDYDNNGNIVIGIGQVIMDCWIVLTFIFWYISLKKGLLSSRTLALALA